MEIMREDTRRIVQYECSPIFTGGRTVQKYNDAMERVRNLPYNFRLMAYKRIDIGIARYHTPNAYTGVSPYQMDMAFL